MDMLPVTNDATIRNRTFDEIKVGDAASIVRTLTAQDIDLSAAMSGDVSHGMWGGDLIAALLGTELPGPGTIYLSQSLQFHALIALGDTITTSVTVREKRPRQQLLFDCRCRNQAGTDVITGIAEVRAPTEKIQQSRLELPDIRIGRHQRFRDLMSRAASLPAVPTAVVHPCDALSLGAAVEAAELGLIIPLLVGPTAKIAAAASTAAIDISRYRVVDVPHSHAAAARAVGLVRTGEATLLMKGSLHTDELMHAVVASETGLRTAKRLSHVYLMDVPSYPRPLLITDAVVNIAPTLEEKRDIVQNAIDLAHVMGIALPRVAILCAVETVNPAMRSTLDAAALCKMADRGQITGALLDGPLAFDNAVSLAAAQQKGIVSSVAGQADILLVPDLEAGNMLAKQLSFLAGADAAGVIVGARAPIILTSRADSARTRVASCAVAVLMVHAQQEAT